MRAYRLREGLQRVEINGYPLPLGIVPRDGVIPVEGFTLDYNAGQDDDPDTYLFTVAVAHDRLPDFLERAWQFLPDRVTPLLEIGSRDAYRTVDVFIGKDSIDKDDFLSGWASYDTFLLEDGSIAAGANAEEPFVEVFVDQFKRVLIHVPLAMRDDVEALLTSYGIEEVPLTWPDQPVMSDDESAEEPVSLRPILQIEDEFSPDIDELLLQLRQLWPLELNIDPTANVDAEGRPLGLTLWHAVVILRGSENEDEVGAYAAVWATAGSIVEMEGLIRQALDVFPGLEYEAIYTIDRVAYDERPDELSDLPPRPESAQIHLISIDPWAEPTSE
ncbi:MAG: hypothetical protein AAF432_02270 [Planctomycetota bacterium]